MNDQIRFQRDVAADLDFVISNYEDVSIPSANRVRDSIRDTFRLITLFPEMYAVAFDDIRVVKIEGYPILVQYRIVNDVPVVASVAFSGAP